MSLTGHTFLLPGVFLNSPFGGFANEMSNVFYYDMYSHIPRLERHPLYGDSFGQWPLSSMSIPHVPKELFEPFEDIFESHRFFSRPRSQQQNDLPSADRNLKESCGNHKKENIPNLHACQQVAEEKSDIEMNTHQSATLSPKQPRAQVLPQCTKTKFLSGPIHLYTYRSSYVHEHNKPPVREDMRQLENEMGHRTTWTSRSIGNSGIVEEIVSGTEHSRPEKRCQKKRYVQSVEEFEKLWAQTPLGENRKYINQRGFTGNPEHQSEDVGETQIHSLQNPPKTQQSDLLPEQIVAYSRLSSESFENQVKNGDEPNQDGDDGIEILEL